MQVRVEQLITSGRQFPLTYVNGWEPAAFVLVLDRRDNLLETGNKLDGNGQYIGTTNQS